MSYIEVSNICKEFHITKRESGAKGAMRSMFHREYTVKKAVDDISFSVERGELVGYIGPNGAGKSTTIKMLSGILTPTSGRATVGGIVPYENRKDNNLRMGVVFGQRSQLYWDLPMGETFELYKRMYKIDDATFKRNVEFYVELLQMQDFLQTPVRQLSLGQKMRGNIAVALLHDPEIVYLDEPTIGLDVLAKSRIRTFIREVNREKNTTLILTTHDMDDIEAICSRLIMIDRGKKIYDGTLAAFKEAYTGENVLIATFATEDPITLPDNRLHLKKEEGPRKWITFKKTEITPMEALSAIERRYPITDFSMRESDIEEIVKEIYEKRG
ncbi:MAG: ATP-binding cassette domain-containing protein [Clostridiaceae bacterium]|nr:ATP-binding cassette domain-containing protein [Clostridiaceae bacterium]